MYVDVVYNGLISYWSIRKKKKNKKNKCKREKSRFYFAMSYKVIKIGFFFGCAQNAQKHVMENKPFNLFREMIFISIDLFFFIFFKILFFGSSCGSIKDYNFQWRPPQMSSMLISFYSPSIIYLLRPKL